METRIYPVSKAAGFEDLDDEELKDWFTELGVIFPKGSKLIYDKAIQRLISTNSSKEAAKIEGIMSELNEGEAIVTVHIGFVEIKPEDIEQLMVESSAKTEKRSPLQVMGFKARETVVNRMLEDGDLKAFFENQDIRFHPEATLRYDKEKHQIIASCLPSNLFKLDSLIRKIDKEVPLVLIEVKTLDVPEVELGDLGFEWNKALK